MKYIILIFVVGLSLLSSCKNDDPDEEKNEADTLRQFIEFSINDTIIKLIENDSIAFSPHWSFESKDSDTNNYVFRVGSSIQIEYNQRNHTRFNNYDILFYSKIRSSQTYIPSNVYLTKFLKPGVLDSLFFPNKIDYLKQGCFDSISNDLFIGMIFPSFEKYQKNYLTHYHGCDKIENTSFYNQNNSTFNIEEVQSYYHKKYGECLLLTGNFRANLYPDPVPIDSNFIQIENGKFKILISEPDTVYPYNYDYQSRYNNKNNNWR